MYKKLYTDYMFSTKRSILLPCLISVILLFTGCQTNRNSVPQNLSWSDISIDEIYNEASLEAFEQPKFRGLVQRDYVGKPESAIGATTSYGGFTQINGYIEQVSIFWVEPPDTERPGPPGDIAWLEFVLLELHAFPKADVDANCYVLIDLEKYWFSELEDYLLFETEDYYIYDLMFFHSEKNYEEYIREVLQPFLDQGIEDNPEYLEDDYIQMMHDLRGWLIERLQQDYPIQ